MKQETIEEVAERLYPNYKQEIFIEGAKFEKERIYSQIKELYDNENIAGFSKLAYAKCLDIVEQFKKK